MSEGACLCALPCAPGQVHVQCAFPSVREGARGKRCDPCPPFPRTAARMPAPGHPARALRFRGTLRPPPGPISLLWSRLHPTRGPAVRSAWREGNWEAGRPVASQRRMPGAGERPPERGPAEQGVPEQRLAGPLGGSWRGRDLTGIELAVGVGAGKASKRWWEDQGRERRLWLRSASPRNPLRVRY